MRSSLVACEQVLRAGLAVIGLIRELSEEDWDFLDPIMSTCWTLASNALISIRRRASHHPLEATRDVSVAAVDKDLGVLVDAMERLSKTFPCAGKSLLLRPLRYRFTLLTLSLSTGANAKMIKLEMAVPDGSQ
ncbi:hypothetical protein PLICRDRAFT_41006 [Plicaturopsis crispa FD-325 SS-3]|nr:hypothetical protein PLICRDRAFT_41006 [Plicaturopsis crispa FD-325 SS-3]